MRYVSGEMRVVPRLEAVAPAGGPAARVSMPASADAAIRDASAHEVVPSVHRTWVPPLAKGLSPLPGAAKIDTE